jgi:hypothetical protein
MGIIGIVCISLILTGLILAVIAAMGYEDIYDIPVYKVTKAKQLEENQGFDITVKNRITRSLRDVRWSYDEKNVKPGYAKVKIYFGDTRLPVPNYLYENIFNIVNTMKWQNEKEVTLK